MRLLYVATTRAKEKLVMIGTVASFAKKQDNWHSLLNHEEWVLPAHYRLASNSYLDWVGPALIRHHTAETRSRDAIGAGVLDDIRLDPSKWRGSIGHASASTNLDD